MKFGFRKPSLMKSIAASTTANFNRAIKKAIIPGYGEKGMGLVNPKKAAYNALYNMTTGSIVDVVGGARRNKSRSNIGKSNKQLTVQNVDISDAYIKPVKHPDHNIQAKQLKAITYKCNSMLLDIKIIDSVKHITKFEQIYYKRGDENQDLYSFIIERIELWRAESSKQWVQMESMIATDIVKMLQGNLSIEDICNRLKSLYDPK